MAEIILCCIAMVCFVGWLVAGFLIATQKEME